MKPSLELLKRVARYTSTEEPSRGLFENALAGNHFKYNKEIDKQLTDVNDSLTDLMQTVREKVILKALMDVYLYKQESNLKDYAVKPDNLVDILEDYTGESFDYYKVEQLYPEVSHYFDLANAALEVALEEFSRHYSHNAAEIEEQSSYTVPLGSSWLG